MHWLHFLIIVALSISMQFSLSFLIVSLMLVLRWDSNLFLVIWYVVFICLVSNPIELTDLTDINDKVCGVKRLTGRLP